MPELTNSSPNPAAFAVCSTYEVRGHWASRWGVTIAATVVTTSLLDLVASGTGVLLVATGTLDRAPQAAILGFLAITYVLWILGIRANLAANWRLLVATGTSSNALSKLAFEIAYRRSGNERARRVASAVGYVAAEIAKEVPYVVGAIGTAQFSQRFDSTDAVLFLGGTNLGAAVYECFAARLTCVYLGRRRSATMVTICESAAAIARRSTDAATAVTAPR
jgi:hypothetical protein